MASARRTSALVASALLLANRHLVTGAEELLLAQRARHECCLGRRLEWPGVRWCRLAGVG